MNEIKEIKKKIESNSLSEKELENLWFNLEKIQQSITDRLSIVQRFKPKSSSIKKDYEDLHNL